jgi:hypothetical protein
MQMALRQTLSANAAPRFVQSESAEHCVRPESTARLHPVAHAAATSQRTNQSF